MLHHHSFTTRAQRLQTNLRSSVADAATYGGMVGLGETYLGAFALAIGLGEVSAGMVASLPLVVGGLLQLLSLRGVRWVGGEKRWILICASLQALTFLPLVVAALIGKISLFGILLIATVYWGAGMATGPAWNTWMEVIVPTRIRTRYFAGRSRFTQFTTLAGFLAGGGLLWWFGERDQVLVGFATMFMLAGVLRMWSVYWLWRHEPIQKVVSSPATASGVKISTPKVCTAAGTRLLVYLVLVQAMVHISGPFFTPYMLEQLEFSYVQYVGIIAMSFVSKIISMSLWVRVTQKHSARTLLWIGGIGLVPLSSLWIFSTHFLWLMAVQVTSGIFWAAYELGFFLMFFEVLPKEKRTRMLTIYNFANSIAVCVGAAIGGALLQNLGTEMNSYYALFGLSSCGRFLALGVLFGLSPVRVPLMKIGTRVLGIRAGSLPIDSPVLTTVQGAHGSITRMHSRLKRGTAALLRS